MWIEVDGTRLHLTTAGQGEAVVLLHGGMADHHAVMPYADPLSSEFRVLAPDQRGSGKSWCSDPLSFDRLTRDLVAVLDHADVSRAVIIGVSAGTGVALHFAFANPARVAGLALIQPVCAGAARGLSQDQAGIFGWMEGIASQTLVEGMEALDNIECPILLAKGADVMHPLIVSEQYLQHLASAGVHEADSAAMSLELPAFCGRCYGKG